MLRGIHRRMEAAEMAGPDRALAEQRRQLQLDLRGESERALRADQDMREVRIVVARQEGVEVVAADAALQLGETILDLLSLARSDGEQFTGERPQRRSGGKAGKV